MLQSANKIFLNDIPLGYLHEIFNSPNQILIARNDRHTSEFQNF